MTSGGSVRGVTTGAALNAQWFADAAVVSSALAAFHPAGRVLEFACGTGIWSELLLPFVSHLTALDGSPEMLAINAARLRSPLARHVAADIFQWQPTEQFDTVFFGFWLSHVPPERFAEFWQLVRSCLAPGGHVFFVDSRHEQTSTAVDHRLPEPDVTVLRRRLNDGLPSDITILTVEKVRHRFHARHDAVARSYLYQIARRKTAFAKPFVWWVKEPLELEPMREAARAFVGFHDFQSFSDDDPREKSTEVAVDLLDIHEDGDLIVVHIEGSHFIWKMVRRLVGVLVAVGRGDLAVNAAATMLSETSDVPARLTAPAAGLFLERVYYPGDRRDLPVRPPVRLP